MKNIKMMAIIGLVFSSFVPILKNDFPDLEKDDGLSIFISRSDKTLFNKTIYYPTNRYNKFVDFEVKSFDLIEEEAKQKNMALKVYENKSSSYFIVVMFSENSEKETIVNTANDKEVSKKEKNKVKEVIKAPISVESENKDLIDSLKTSFPSLENKTV